MPPDHAPERGAERRSTASQRSARPTSARSGRIRGGRARMRERIGLPRTDRPSGAMRGGSGDNPAPRELYGGRGGGRRWLPE
uniref:Uncharacterized protein n=1 Tax=Arundo donax TaxID=35708 RepID=A0A0A9E6Y8_ARUDO